MSDDIVPISIILSIYSTMFLMIFAICIIEAVANYKLFTKAGKAGWLAFIPIVSSYQKTAIAFGERRAWWFLSDLLLGGFFSMYRDFNLAKAYGAKGGFSIGYMFFPFIMGFILAFSDDYEYEGPRPFILD